MVAPPEAVSIQFSLSFRPVRPVGSRLYFALPFLYPPFFSKSVWMFHFYSVIVRPGWQL